ncbi:MAG: hypothetical protein HY848_00085 [Betaproteobacteria bacterium]|nr:hypothetical protein [Betaproteobacteria bacterium]
MIEYLLAKIAASVLAKSSLGTLFSPLLKAVEIYSVVEAVDAIRECAETSNDCTDLKTFGVNVAVEHLSQTTIDQLLKINSDSFRVTRAPSGVYVASRLAKEFLVPPTLNEVLLAPKPDLTRIHGWLNSRAWSTAAWSSRTW